jgi:hypothetical protein
MKLLVFLGILALGQTLDAFQVLPPVKRTLGGPEIKPVPPIVQKPPVPTPPPGGDDVATRAMTADKRGYVAGKYSLQLAGLEAGWLFSAEGGNPVGDVVHIPDPSPTYDLKRLAGLKYEPIQLAFGTGMSKSFMQWITETLEGSFNRRDGAVLTADTNYQIQSQMTFTNACISEVAFPALDAASKDAARMTVTLRPERTQALPGSAGQVSIDRSKVGPVQKKWLAANFRLSITGLEQDCAHVNKISPIVVKVKFLEAVTGNARDTQAAPARLEISDLVVTFPESHSNQFRAWCQDFLVNGNNGQAMEKAGKLEFLTPNLQEVLFTLTFDRLGIVKMEQEKAEAGSENIRRVQATLYCGHVVFSSQLFWAHLIRTGAGSSNSWGSPE